MNHKLSIYSGLKFLFLPAAQALDCIFSLTFPKLKLDRVKAKVFPYTLHGNKPIILLDILQGRVESFIVVFLRQMYGDAPALLVTQLHFKSIAFLVIDIVDWYYVFGFPKTKDMLKVT